MKTFQIPRPFVRWAGGKHRIASTLMRYRPATFRQYHEPFVGSGALFFRLYRDGMVTHAVLSDINADLIATYQAIRDQVDDVITHLMGYPPNDRSVYDRLRRTIPPATDTVARAARLLYLNMWCYNGLYRVNRHGMFNVPFGNRPPRTSVDIENLHAVSAALKHVTLSCAPFPTVLDRVAAGDWVYFDPPYVPVSRTAGFTAYTAQGFTEDDHRLLRDLCVRLHAAGVSVMISNSDTPFVRSLYAAPVFRIHDICAPRMITCRPDGRKTVTELVITTYHPTDLS
jgi:DNA adenine methylase